MIPTFFSLILYRASAELRSEGTRTYAGYFWWIFEPLLTLFVYYVAFKYIFHRDTEHFALFLFIGIVIFRFFSGTVIRSATSIRDGSGLMQQVYVHKTFFPLSVVLVNLLKFIVTFFLVLIACWFSHLEVTAGYAYLPLLILLQLVMTAGVSMICAAITPFFPDFQLILNTLIHLLIFLSGVFYDIRDLSPPIQDLFRLNPLAAMIEQYRQILLHGGGVNLSALGPALGESCLLFIVGWVLIHRYDRYFPKIS